MATRISKYSGKTRVWLISSSSFPCVLIPVFNKPNLRFHTNPLLHKKQKTWPGRDLNTQPSALEADALPLRHQVPYNISSWLEVSLLLLSLIIHSFLLLTNLTHPDGQALKNILSRPITTIVNSETKAPFHGTIF